jgi:hypothetical protein
MLHAMPCIHIARDVCSKRLLARLIQSELVTEPLWWLVETYQALFVSSFCRPGLGLLASDIDFDESLPPLVKVGQIKSSTAGVASLHPPYVSTRDRSTRVHKVRFGS